MAVVVETNVLATANQFATHASPECVLQCVRRLREISNGEVVLLDNLQRILNEYRSYASLGGRPGPGDAFMRWIWDNQANTEVCRLVMITPREEDPNDFVEFPRDPELAKFDRSDRKWVAVALASHLEPPILNAVDTDWWDFREPLERNGVRIEFLCPELMGNKKGRKHGRHEPRSRRKGA